MTELFAAVGVAAACDFNTGDFLCFYSVNFFSQIDAFQFGN